MPYINTLEELLDCFDCDDPSEQIVQLQKSTVPIEQFEKFATWKTGGYTRNCLARSEKYELLLLCWDSNTKSPVHGHGGQDCWVYQVMGRVEEKRFKRVDETFEETKAISLSEGELSFMSDDLGYHSIENHSDKRAMTLHLYAQPIDSCKVFNKSLNKFEVKQMAYDSKK